MADIEITLPDKFVLKFPEGTPPDVIQRHSANEWMRRTSAASKAEPNAGSGSFWDTPSGRMLKGVNTAVNYVGTRAINAATNVAGLPRFIGDLAEMVGPGKGPEPQTALGRTLKPIHEAIDPVRWLQKMPSAVDMQQAIYSSPDAPPSPFNIPRQDSGVPIVDMAAEGAIGMMPGGVGLARQGADMAGRLVLVPRDCGTRLKKSSALVVACRPLPLCLADWLAAASVPARSLLDGLRGIS
jgi:hypothetical protein